MLLKHSKTDKKQIDENQPAFFITFENLIIERREA